MEYIAFVRREGRHWLVEFPDCPGCQTFASTEEALSGMARDALRGWLEAHLELGRVPPLPRARRRAPARARQLAVRVPLDLAVAMTLRTARLRLGLTQAELAKRANVSQQQVAKLERPGENPTVGSIEKFLAALGSVIDLEVTPVGTVRGARRRQRPGKPIGERRRSPEGHRAAS